MKGLEVEEEHVRKEEEGDMRLVVPRVYHPCHKWDTCHFNGY